LSKKNIVGVDCEYPRFAKRWCNQTISFVAMITSTYSILVVELVVYCCLWLTQVIGPPLRKTMQPLHDLWSLRSSSWSTFT
jgi:hypothetical protein